MIKYLVLCNLLITLIAQSGLAATSDVANKAYDASLPIGTRAIALKTLIQIGDKTVYKRLLRDPIIKHKYPILFDNTHNPDLVFVMNKLMDYILATKYSGNSLNGLAYYLGNDEYLLLSIIAKRRLLKRNDKLLIPKMRKTVLNRKNTVKQRCDAVFIIYHQGSTSELSMLDDIVNDPQEPLPLRKIAGSAIAAIRLKEVAPKTCTKNNIVLNVYCRDAYKMEEMFGCEMSLVNEGNKSVSYKKYGHRIFSFSVTNSSGELITRTKQGERYLSNDIAHTELIKPGEKRTGQARLASYFNLSKVGKYVLHVSVNMSNNLGKEIPLTVSSAFSITGNSNSTKLPNVFLPDKPDTMSVASLTIGIGIVVIIFIGLGLYIRKRKAYKKK